MPQVGEKRTSGGETRQWNGSRWEEAPAAQPSTVDNPTSFGLLDAIPGLRDVLNIPGNIVKGAKALPDVASGLLHEPAATLKGFASGASEAATPGRTGMLALLTGGASVPAAMAAAGGQAAADATRVATGAPNAPKSFGGGVGDVAEAASVPAIAAAVNTIPGIARQTNGLVDAGLEAGSHLPYVGGSVRAAAKLKSAIGALAGDGADAVSSAVDRYLPSRSGVRVSKEVPGFSMPSEAATPAPAAEPALPTSTMADVDRYLPNKSGLSPTPAPTNPAAASLDNAINGLKAPAEMPPDTASPAPSGASAVGPSNVGSMSEFQKLDRDGAFGGDRTTGHFEEGPGGLTGVYQEMLQKLGGRGAAMETGADMLDDAPAATSSSERSPMQDAIDNMHQTVDSYVNDRATRYSPRMDPGPMSGGGGTAVMDAPAETTTEAASPNFRQIPRGDENWGPGATDAQAGSSKANLLYDPQTPTSYLREQLSGAPEGSPDREFLARSLRQRYKLEQSLGGLSR